MYLCQQVRSQPTIIITLQPQQILLLNAECSGQAWCPRGPQRGPAQATRAPSMGGGGTAGHQPTVEFGKIEQQFDDCNILKFSQSLTILANKIMIMNGKEIV